MNRSEWFAIEHVLRGKSILDADSLIFSSEAEAYQFLLTYGFDWYEPEHVRKLSDAYQMALSFVRDFLGINIDSRLDFVNQVPPLLELLAGIGPYSKEDKLKICGILKVMHVLLHVRSDLRLRYMSKIRKKTIGRIESHLQKEKVGDKENLYLGFESDKIQILNFETKDRKIEFSVILKLLIKPEAVAQEVHDYLGVRFVTKTRSEAVFLLNYLIKHHLISFANMIGARCRNTLVDIESFSCLLEKYPIGAGNGVSSNWHCQVDRELKYPETSPNSDNVFSASSYRSIQITSRPLIRIPIIRKGKKAELSFFFPVEIQIFDEASYLEAQKGIARHDQYKAKQMEAARQRIMRGSSI